MRRRAARRRSICSAARAVRRRAFRSVARHRATRTRGGGGGAPAHRRLFTAGELQQGAPSAMTAAPLAAPPPPLKTELEILHEAGDQKFGRSRRSRWQRREQQQAPPHALQAPPASPPRAARSSLSLGFGTPPAPGRGGAAPAPALAAGQRRSRDAEPRTKPPPATRPAPFATFDAAAALHKPPVQSLRNFSAARATAVGAAPPRAPVRSLRDFHKDDATGGGARTGRAPAAAPVAREPRRCDIERVGATGHARAVLIWCTRRARGVRACARCYPNVPGCSADAEVGGGSGCGKHKRPPGLILSTLHSRRVPNAGAS